jgi:hypothetical protein
MLIDLLSKGATVAVLSFVVSSMLGMGTGLTVAQLIGRDISSLSPLGSLVRVRGLCGGMPHG